MGFALLTVTRSAKVAPEAPALLLVYPAGRTARPASWSPAAATSATSSRRCRGDPIGTWASLPGNGKERKLSGYPSGTKLWVHFAQIRWGLQGPWSVPVLITIP